MERYAEEGVEEYLTVLPVVERKAKDLVGCRLSDQGEYETIPPDAEGRVYSEQLGLYFSIDPGSEELVAVDAETGQRLLTSEEEASFSARSSAWRRASASRSAGMGSAQLEALWADLLSRKRWHDRMLASRSQGYS